MSAAHAAMVVSAISIAALMIGTWLLSVMLKNASIVDVVWGLGFVVVAWTVRMRLDSPNPRAALIVAMTTIWGLRLAVHLFTRNRGKGEDFRYRAMRRRRGSAFPLISLVTVFVVQGVLMWIVSLPVQLGQTRHTNLGAIAWLGLGVWVLGLCFEAVGDHQLAVFKRDPASAGTVMDRGLWRYTRHPNYFGDACVWWGIALVAIETGIGAWGLIGAVVMTVLLVRVSGMALLERSLMKRRPGYAEYVRVTPAFIPRLPAKD